METADSCHGIRGFLIEWVIEQMCEENQILCSFEESQINIIALIHFFERSLFCLPRLHLFDQKSSKNGNILNCNLFQWWQSWIFSSRYSTWSFRNHSNSLIWCSRNNSYISLRTVLNIFLKHNFSPQYSLINGKYKITSLIWNSQSKH